eukprot:TRINITY_DN4157_c0_g1_i1.p1 TRINITY_DN4157_c0_g1~~TRINITY_DN4157_c0_g1_i1.p1  ORF type:complete len:306 (+),score=44.80 TRINITY_DN4157_c0_g1_i1:538-1455(+)
MGSPHVTMKSKTQKPLNLKYLLLGFFLVFLLLFILRSNFSSSSPQNPPSNTIEQLQTSPPTSPPPPPPTCPPAALPSPSPCTKIPPSIIQALIHYSTSNITPQQTLKEISITSQVLQQKSPCNFLVFGLGHDSLMWSTLNFNGRTVFLEEDKSWIDQITQRFPSLESYHVAYDSKVRQAEELMEIGKREECSVVGDVRYSKCGLSLKNMPDLVYEVEWDLIMVDAPTGYILDAPGRMGAIYTAGMMGRNRGEGETDVFVHDVDRVVEDKFSNTFLCEGYLRKQEGRLRHFSIPSHRGSLGKPFCP